MIVLFQGLWGFLLALETKSHFCITNWAVTHFLAKAGLEFAVILLPVPPKCWVIGMSHHIGSQVLLPASGRRHSITPSLQSDRKVDFSHPAAWWCAHQPRHQYFFLVYEFLFLHVQ